MQSSQRDLVEDASLYLPTAVLVDDDIDSLVANVWVRKDKRQPSCEPGAEPAGRIDLIGERLFRLAAFDDDGAGRKGMIGQNNFR